MTKWYSFQLKPWNPQNGSNIRGASILQNLAKKGRLTLGDIVYSKVRTLRMCLRTTFSIAKNETSSLTRIYVGPFTAQIKCPRDWQLTGVDATGGRTGQSFPLHILSDKILLFSNARHAGSRYVMLWVSSVSVQSQTSSRLARDSNSNAFLHLVPFSTALILMKNSPCFGAKLHWGLNPIQKSFALAGNMGWKKNIG